jgi:hypothetical protein
MGTLAPPARRTTPRPSPPPPGIGGASATARPNRLASDAPKARPTSAPTSRRKTKRHGCRRISVPPSVIKVFRIHTRRRSAAVDDPAHMAARPIAEANIGPQGRRPPRLSHAPLREQRTNGEARSRGGAARTIHGAVSPRRDSPGEGDVRPTNPRDARAAEPDEAFTASALGVAMPPDKSMSFPCIVPFERRRFLREPAPRLLRAQLKS